MWGALSALKMTHKICQNKWYFLTYEYVLEPVLEKLRLGQWNENERKMWGPKESYDKTGTLKGKKKKKAKESRWIWNQKSWINSLLQKGLLYCLKTVCYSHRSEFVYILGALFS